MRYGQASRTAKMVAFWRDLGDQGLTSVPNFSDPGARQLLTGPFWRFMLSRGDILAKSPQGKTASGMRPWIDGLLMRVAFIDAAIVASGARQVVIVGAGLDTRAWRLPALRGARVFEVDHPDTQAYKRVHAAKLGAPLADVRYVAVDFRRDSLARELIVAGYDVNAPTVWAWEGVIMYLDDAALRGTLNGIRTLSIPGSTLIAHYHLPEVTRSASGVRKLLFSLLGEPQIGLRTQERMRDEVTRAGFEVIEDAGIAEQAARVGAKPSSDPRIQVSRILIAKRAAVS
jgi:methyltransferase (TIGR00027 family)